MQWTERRYRERQVSDATQTDSAARTRPPARIDGRLRAAVRDTVVAVPFAGSPFHPAYPTGGLVHLADPSGVTTPIAATVVARLPFSAPSVPAADPARATDWRHGWAYLVVHSSRAGEAHPGGYDGWRVVSARAASATRPVRRSDVAP